MSASVRRRIAATRRGLLLTSALIGCAALPQVAWGQSKPLPTIPPGRVLPKLDGTPPNKVTITTSSDRLTETINLGGANRNLAWKSFDVDTLHSVVFDKGDPRAPRLTAINRVTGPNASLIYGSIVANDVNVWLINQEGITFGPGGSFSGGSLVLSTLPIVPSAAATEIQFAGSSIEPIRFFGGGDGKITADGSIIVVAQNIENESGRTLEAVKGAVALVAATDVTFNSGFENPLSITINAGTKIAGAIINNGTLKGGSVQIVGGAAQAINAALLNVELGGTLTATATNGTIVIATQTTKGEGITFAKAVAGAATVKVTGALSTTGATSDIIVNVRGDATVSGSATATRNVSFTSGGALTSTGIVKAGNGAGNAGNVTFTSGEALTTGGSVSASGATGDVTFTASGALTAGGAVSADGDYSATGTSVKLVGAPTTTPVSPPTRQSANGAVTIKATTGDITSTGNLDLASAQTTGAGTLTLSAVDGAITLSPGISLLAGAASATDFTSQRTEVHIASLGEIALGSVTARALGSDGSLRATGNFSSGSIDVDKPLIIRAGGTIDIAGTVKVRDAALPATDGVGIDLRGTDVTVTGQVRTNGTDILASASGAISLAAVSTTLSKSVAPTAGTIALGAGGSVTATGQIDAGEDFAARAGTDIVLAGVHAGDDAVITATGDLTFAKIKTDGTGADDRSVTFAGKPGTPPTISIAASTADDSNIDLTAASILSKSALTGSTDTGLVVESLKAGQASSLTAAVGDIRVGDATAAAGTLDVRADAGSISGLKQEWTPASGGSVLSTTGNVRITAGKTGKVEIGAISAGGSVENVGTTESIRIGTVTKADSLNLNATTTLQLGGAKVTNGATLKTTGRAATAPTGPISGQLVSGYDRATLTAKKGALTVSALEGAAQLGTLTGTSVDARAAALDVTTARATGTDLFLLATDGRLTLGTGSAVTTATLWKRDLDAAAGGTPDHDDALFVTTSVKAGKVDIRSATDLDVASATAKTDDLLVQAAGDATLTKGEATKGSLALLAGGSVTSTTLKALQGDVSVYAYASGTDLAPETVTLGSIEAADDVDLFAKGGLSFTSITTGGGGSATATGISFTPGQAGRGTATATTPPTLTGGGITTGGDDTLTGNAVRIRAGSVTGAGATALAENALLVGTLRAASASITADAGNIRLNTITATTGNLDVTAKKESVTGLKAELNVAGPTIATAGGDVSIVSMGDVSVGTIDTKKGSAKAGDVRIGRKADGTGAARSINVGTILNATNLTATAKTGLQVGTATLRGAATLHTTRGARNQTVSLTDAVLADGYGRASLKATAGALTVSALKGVAQLDVLTGKSVDVSADALDISSATATDTSLFLLAEKGRLTLGTGDAKTTAVLEKRDDDAVAGTAATPQDALFVTTVLNANSGIDIRSLTDAVVQSATTKTGNLLVQAAGNATLTEGKATAGSLAVLAGGAAKSSGSLIAGEDVAVRAATAQLSHIEAGDDIDLTITGLLELPGRLGADGDLIDTGLGHDTDAVVFDVNGAGQSDPASAFAKGGIRIDHPDTALPGHVVSIHAGSIDGGTDGGVIDDGLVVGTLDGTATTATFTAKIGDVRIGSAGVSGDLTVRAGGSISGIKTGWTGATGVSIKTDGDVRLDVTNGDVTLGSIHAHDVTGTGSPGSVRIGTVTAHDVTLSADSDLQIGTATLSGSADLHTSGPVQTAQLTGDTLVVGHTNANLSAGGVLRVNGSVGSVDGAAGGAAQLGVIKGSTIDVRANAVTIAGRDGVVAAKASNGAIFVLAQQGDLSLDSADATGGITLLKRGTAGLLQAVGPRGLSGSDIDLRSATDLDVSLATATTGDLLVQAGGNATLTKGEATAGSLAVLAGGSITSTTLTATADVSAYAAGGGATFGSVKADDDVDLFAHDTLSFSSIEATGQGADSATTLTFTPEQAGNGALAETAPVSLTGGGIVPGGQDTLTGGSNVRIQAGSVNRNGVVDPTEAALVVGQLTGTSAAFTADTGDIRLGGTDAAGKTNGFIRTSGDLTVTATGGSLSPTGGSVTGLADGWMSSAGQSTITTAGGSVSIASIGAVAVGTIDARTGDVTIGSNAAGTGASTSIAVGAIETAANLTMTAQTGLEVKTATLTGAATLHTTGGSPSEFGLVGMPLVPDYGRASLEATAGLLKVSALEGVAQLGTLTAKSIDVRADALDISSATATGTSLFLLAEKGGLTLGTGDAKTTATLEKRDDDAVVGAPADTRDALRVTTSLTGETGVAVGSATDATLAKATATTGNFAVQAGRDVVVTTGTASAGRVSLFATRGSVTSADRLTAGTSLLISAGADATLAAITAASGIDVRAAGNAGVTSAIATGGDLLVQAGGAVSLATGIATKGTLALLAGATVTSTGALTAAEDIAVRAGGDATFGALKAGDDLDLYSGGTLTLSDAAVDGSGIDTRSVVFTSAQAGLGDPTVAGTGGIAVGAPESAALASSGIRMEALGTIEIATAGTNGSINAVRAPGRAITIVNGGTGATAIGDGAVGTFALSNAEFGELDATSVVVASGGNDVNLGTLAISDATGTDALRFLTTGKVTLAGAIMGGGSGTLQIGGADGAAPAGLVDGTALAQSIVADTGAADEHASDGSVVRVNGAGLSFANGVVDLRAKQIVFGNSNLSSKVNAFADETRDAGVARLISDANSPVYTGNTTHDVYLSAKTVTVSYSNFAVFQNTFQGVSRGVELNANKSNSGIVLQLFSTGNDAGNSFAMFGTINGLVSRAAALLPNTIVNIADPGFRLRITQANSRVNGCIIGSPDQGCLNVDLPATQFRLYDERQTQLFTTSTDPSIYANPLIGRGNEGLIVDIADVPVGIDTIECPTDEPNCRKEGSPR